jgi:hypothetical protein
MTALAQTFSQAASHAASHVSTTETGTGTLRMLALFCGAGLAISLIFASYGLDLSAGFF